MSEKMKQCKNCNTSEKIYDFYNNPKYHDFIKFWNGFICYGELKTFCKNESYNQDFQNDVCPFCKGKLTNTMLTRDDFRAIGEYSNDNRDLLLAMIELRKKDVIEFETKMLPFREAFKKKQDEKEQKRQDYIAHKNSPHCPKCGSTSVTPMRKKWSLLSGFMTNKVELVCNNCGTKVR